VSEYDAIADAYDDWARVGDDIPFYVEEARGTDLVVELGIGSGRVGVPIAQAGGRVIGIDSSERMLELCRLRAREAGVAEQVEVRLGDFRQPPVSERVQLVIAPFRSLSHLETDADRSQALAAVQRMLLAGGRFIFDVATPNPEQVRSSGTLTPSDPGGLTEHAEWDWEKRELRLTLTQNDKVGEGDTQLRLSWLTREEWRAAIEGADLEVDACYGWFDRRPAADGGYSIWVAHRARV
jgi:SAM-dependent methyltransferase